MISGIALPESAKFIEHRGGSNNLYYRWKLDFAEIERIAVPDGATQLFDLPMSWTRYDGSFFGSLSAEAVAADAEALYYRTSFWDVALIRSRSEESLIVAAIYTN